MGKAKKKKKKKNAHLAKKKVTVSLNYRWYNSAYVGMSPS
jgi:hypothetical protein